MYHIMWGGSLTRYRPPPLPPQDGRGLREDLYRLGGPILARAVEAGARAGARGQSWRGVARAAGEELKRGVKRKAVPITGTVAKRSMTSAAKKGYRNTVGCIRDVLGV